MSPRTKRLLKLLLLGGALVAAPTPSTAAREALKDRFYREYPQAHQRLKQAYLRLEAVGLVNQPSGTAVPHAERSVRICLNDSLRKIDVRDYRVDAGNRSSTQQEYACLIGRAADIEIGRNPANSNSYSLMLIERKSADSAASGKVGTLFNWFGGFAPAAPCGAPAFDLLRLLDRKIYRLDNVEQIISSDDEKLVRVDFANVQRRPGLLEGVAYFLPDRGWALRQLELTSKPTAVAGIPTGIAYQLYLEVRHGTDQEGIPLIRKVYLKDPSQATQVDFSAVRLGVDIPERDFNLGYYSLPDLTKPPPDPTRSSIVSWLVGGGLVTLIGALVLRRRA